MRPVVPQYCALYSDSLRTWFVHVELERGTISLPSIGVESESERGIGYIITALRYHHYNAFEYDMFLTFTFHQGARCGIMQTLDSFFLFIFARICFHFHPDACFDIVPYPWQI